MSEEDRIAQALELVKAGRRVEAQTLVAQVILANKNNARAWILMAKLVDDPQKALQCWQEVARLKPDDLRVQQEIAQLKGEPMPPAQPLMGPAGAPFAQLAAPIARKRKTGLPWLIGAGAAVIVIVAGVALAIANMAPQPDADPQAMSAAKTVVTPTEPSRPTDTPLPATATTERQPRSTSGPISATDAPTTIPATATTGPTATSQPAAADTPTLSQTPSSADTALPPAATQPSNLFKPGTYLVGTEIAPGVYRGKVESSTPCYWARFEDATEVLADSNSTGQFYLEVRSSDYALEIRCDVVPLAALPANTGGFPQSIEAGMYLVGKDIQAGTYNGQTGDDSSAGCYWERLSDVAGELDSIIANDYVTGQFVVQVAADDFALLTECKLERVGG